MKTKLVIIPIDNILALFKDYAGMVSVPDDAVVNRLLLNPQERKMALELESPSWKTLQPQEEIRFDLQRTWVVN